MSEDSIKAILGSGFDAKRPWRALKPDAQAFDHVVIKTVPRYKTSGLSGDEWRISGVIEFWRKGKLIHERGFRDVETACRYADIAHAEACDNGLGHFGGEEDICDQEGCCEPATVTYQLKHSYCRDGHKSELHRPTIRMFCEKHKTRGDCGLDDADANYTLISR